MKIAIAGKGGVGKTTISANLAKLFAREGFNVYAVDADPDSNLGFALGIEEEVLRNIKPIIEMKDVMDNKMGDSSMYSLNPEVNDIADRFSLKLGRIKFLKMGGIKQGGSECYCRENTFLTAVVESLFLNKNDVVVLDMGAGIEHLTRGTARSVDLLLVVTEPSRAGIQTAKIAEKLAKDLHIGEVKFIVNKIRTANEESFVKENLNEDDILGVVHYDETIGEKSMGIGLSLTQVDNKELEDTLGKLIN